MLAYINFELKKPRVNNFYKLGNHFNGYFHLLISHKCSWLDSDAWVQFLNTLLWSCISDRKSPLIDQRYFSIRDSWSQQGVSELHSFTPWLIASTHLTAFLRNWRMETTIQVVHWSWTSVSVSEKSQVESQDFCNKFTDVERMGRVPQVGIYSFLHHVVRCPSVSLN